MQQNNWNAIKQLKCNKTNELFWRKETALMQVKVYLRPQSLCQLTTRNRGTLPSDGQDL